MINGVTGIHIGDYAVYAFGMEAWYCPMCNHGTTMVNAMPLGPASCERCGATLEPWTRNYDE